jgi:hypothetical protein
VLCVNPGLPGFFFDRVIDRDHLFGVNFSFVNNSIRTNLGARE